jgi:hypothetical protein
MNFNKKRVRHAYFSIFPQFRKRTNFDITDQESLNTFMIDREAIECLGLPIGAFHYYVDVPVVLPSFDRIKDVTFVGNPYYNITGKYKLLLPYPASYLHSYLYPKSPVVYPKQYTANRCFVCNSVDCYPSGNCFKSKLGVI